MSHRSDAAAAASCIETPPSHNQSPFRFRAPHPDLKNLLLRLGRPAEGSQPSRSPAVAAGKTVAARSFVKAEKLGAAR